MNPAVLVIVFAGALQLQATSPPATATVVGRVIDAATGRPIGGAIVTPFGTPAVPETAPGTPAPAPPRVMTNGSGMFVIRGLRKGALSLTATKPGYVNATNRQRRPEGSAQPIDIAEGQRVTDVEIRMWRYGVVTGTIVDEAGEPAIGVRVQAYRRLTTAGRRRYAEAGFANTDDRGSYRLASMAPGDYIVAVPSMQASVPKEIADAYFGAKAVDSAKRREIEREVFSFGPLTSGITPGTTVIGDSLLSAVGPSAGLPAMPRGDDRVFVYPTTFYPTASNAAQATVVTVRPGEERGGVDLQLRPVAAARVAGSVIGPDGPASFTAVRLLPAHNDELIDLMTAAGTVTNGSGGFTFPAVPPGEYLLRVVRVPTPPFNTDDPSRVTIVQSSSGAFVSTITTSAGPTVPPAIPKEPTLCGSATVSVAGHDVTDLLVPLATGARVIGRVEFDGASEKPAARTIQSLRITLEPADGTRTIDSTLRFETGHPDDNGQFTTYGVPPGRYVLRTNAPASGWYLKSALYQGRDLLDTPIDLEGKDVAGVVITFTDRPSAVSGVIRSGQSADEDSVAIVFPTDSSTWSSTGSTPRRMRTGRARKDGSFEIQGLPAGEYYIAAVKEEMLSDWQDPALLTALSRIAERMQLGESERKTMNLVAAAIQ